jgi:hypothetical protein
MHHLQLTVGIKNISAAQQSIYDILEIYTE